MRQQLGIKDNRFTWLAVGRFDDQKNYPVLLRAIKKAADGNTVLYFAGVGRQGE